MVDANGISVTEGKLSVDGEINASSLNNGISLNKLSSIKSSSPLFRLLNPVNLGIAKLLIFEKSSKKLENISSNPKLKLTLIFIFFAQSLHKCNSVFSPFNELLEVNKHINDIYEGCHQSTLTFSNIQTNNNNSNIFKIKENTLKISLIQ